MALVAPLHVGSSRTRDRACVPCMGRQTPNPWTTREDPGSFATALIARFFGPLDEWLVVMQMVARHLCRSGLLSSGGYLRLLCGVTSGSHDGKVGSCRAFWSFACKSDNRPSLLVKANSRTSLDSGDGEIDLLPTLWEEWAGPIANRRSWKGWKGCGRRLAESEWQTVSTYFSHSLHECVQNIALVVMGELFQPRRK